MKDVNHEKTSNIKCEHCKFWIKAGYNNGVCGNPKADNYDQMTNYWKRCKNFDWSK